MPDSEITITIPQPVAPDGQSQTMVTSHKQVVEALLKFHGIHEGVWGLFVRFALGASNVGPDDQSLNPAAIVAVPEIGLQKFEKETSLSVDAAKVNPKGLRDIKNKPRSHK